jgi:tetratricopeptide (TPR) repeat protein
LEARDVGDAASKLEHELTDAQKSLVAYKACTNDARAQKYAEAVAEARKGLALYPNSSLNNLCILNVYAQQKAGPDSIITVASAIRAIDSTSAIALANLGDAYQAKHDTANAIDTYLALGSPRSVAFRRVRLLFSRRRTSDRRFADRPESGRREHAAHEVAAAVAREAVQGRAGHRRSDGERRYDTC